MVTQLTKVDVTRYAVTDWRIAFLSLHGFRVKFNGWRVFMVREVRR